jgi:hypothetical protein
MNVASPYEKRCTLRAPCEERGLLRLEGLEPMMVRLRDTSHSGIGAYSRKPAPVGAHALLNVKLVQDRVPQPYPTQIRWCAPCKEGDISLYAYRLGLLILSSPPKATAAPTPAPSATPLTGTSPAGWRVKGSMIIDLAKMVRRHHDKPWQKYFSLEDMKALNEMIIPAKWYPVGLFQRAGTAIYQIFGHGDPNSARQWGRDQIDRVPSDLYQSFFNKNDPKKAGTNYINVSMRVFDFLRFKCQEGDGRELMVHALGEAEVRQNFPELELVAHIMAGALEELARRNGGNNPTAKVETASQADKLLAINLTWL